MARIRTIKPEFPQSGSMGRVSREARLCFVLLWTVADDGGRLRGNSRMLASLLYPYDDDAKKHIDRWLDELGAQHCLVRYTVGDDEYIQIIEWTKHQKIDKPTISKLPAPPDRRREDSRDFANGSEDSAMDRKGREGKGGSDEEDVPPLVDLAQPPVALIPLVDGTDYPVTATQASEWTEAFPAVNVPQRLLGIRAWCLANPTKRKTRRGVGAFIVRWLSKDQDSGRSGGSATPQAGLMDGAI